MGVVSPGRGRRVFVAVTITLCTLAWASASFARPAGSADGHAVTAATCAPLTLQTGKSGVLKLKAQRGSLAIVSSKLAPGVKAKTKTRTITKIGLAAYRYALSKNAARGETVRVLVAFGKGKKVMKTKTVACSVKIGKPPVTLTLTVAGEGVGKVDSAPAGLECTNETSPCKNDFPAGTKVTLTPQPDETSEFTGWDGACTGTGACAVTTSAAKSVTANFAKKQFTLTIQKAGDGSGTVTSTGSPLNCGAVCTGKFPAGTIVRLKATADATSQWDGWTGECSSTATQCNVSVDANVTVTANFALKGFRLAVSRAGAANGGSISASVPPIDCGLVCSATYAPNTVVTLTANPAPGMLFEGWFSDCSGSPSTTCTLTMDRPHTAAASFQPGKEFSVSVAAGTGTGTLTSNNGGINCDERGAAAPGNTCTGLWFHDRTVTLTATPDAGSSFDSWENCPAESGNSCQGTPDDFAAATPVAHFKSP